MRVLKTIRDWLATLLVKLDRETYNTIINTNENSVFISEDELKWLGERKDE